MSIRINTTFLSSLILSAAPLHGTAEGIWINMPADLTDGFRREAVSDNPAAMPFAGATPQTVISLNGEYADTDATRRAEDGDGHLLGSVSAESYLRPGDKTTVWGHARFLAGKIRDVSWNNSADYDLAGPYVIGDPVGGDLTRRSYNFAGGYAGHGDRWSWGAEASYRAGIDYRGCDPRDRIIVSDLNVSIGGSWRPTTAPMAIGLTGSARVYNQSAEIEFYSPLNDIDTYAMTGLGSYYPRFSGNSSRNTAYSGAGFSGALSIFQTDDTARPVMANVNFGYIHLRQYLRDFNNLELTHTATVSLGGELGFLISTASGITCGSVIKVSYRIKKGTENLLGPSTGNSYPKIDDRQNYTSEQLSASVSLPAEKCFGASDRFLLEVSATFNSVSEKLNDPLRKIAATGITPGFRALWEHSLNSKTKLTFCGTLSRRFADTGDIILTGVEHDSELGRCVDRLAALTTSDVTGYSISGRIDFPVKLTAGLFVRASWRRESFQRRCGKADFINLSLGIRL